MSSGRPGLRSWFRGERACWQAYSLFAAHLAIGGSLLAACDAFEPPPEPAPPIDETTHSGIDALLRRMVDEEHFTGSVLVADGDEVVHARGYGAASNRGPNRVDTLFHVASITKQFTAAAVMQQVEAGAVELHESINRYLPVRYRAPQWEPVTVHHLLTHSSGITDYAVTRDYYEVEKGFCLGNTVDGMMREAMGKPLEFEPGSRHSYSNIGFTLLGHLLEEQTGDDYATYVEENVLAPMGMSSSRLHVEGHVPFEREAQGYRWSAEEGAHVPDDVVSLPVTAPDGGLITSLAEFRAWTGIYTGEQQSILAESSIALMTAQHIPPGGRRGPMPSYGYGLATGERFIGHAGYIVGFRSQFILDRETGMLIAVFTNNTSNNPQRIAGELLTIMLSTER